MKRIIVMSDSHGSVSNMALAVNKEKPDMIIHLGDCWQDATLLKNRFPDVIIERVPGNCDYCREPEERILLIEGRKILICHGHTLNVKAGYLSLEMRAQEQEADIALFGHTHQVYYDRFNAIHYLNPGSIGLPPWGVPPSYGMLYVDGKTGTIRTEVFYME